MVKQDWISKKGFDYSQWTNVVNPEGKDEAELPRIYVFINGWMAGPVPVAVSADGYGLGSHACSSEGFIPSDMGLYEGSRPDRHEAYLKHYPQGYVMEYVPDFDIAGHEGINEAIRLNNERGVVEEEK